MPKGQGWSDHPAQVFPEGDATRARHGTEQEHERRFSACLLGPVSSSESIRDAGAFYPALSRPEAHAGENRPSPQHRAATDRSVVAVTPAQETMRGLWPAAPCYGTCLGAHSSVLELFIAGPLLERQGQVNPQQLWGQQLWDRSTHLAP